MQASAEYLSIPGLFLKAQAATEGDRRFVYLEASREARDFEGETVLAKALSDSAPYFQRYGNCDLDHWTIKGPLCGMSDYARFEVGRPAEVRVDGGQTFVKAYVYQGDGKVAESANLFWHSLTSLTPPQQWYPSVGGAVLGRAQDFDPLTKSVRQLVTAVRWANIGFSKTPVNPSIPAVQTTPFDILAKSFCVGASVRGFDLAKAMEATGGLTAGYGTDSATLSGGAALRTQSLDHGVQNYWDFRDRLARDLKQKRVAGHTPQHLVDHACQQYGMERGRASEWVERFSHDLHHAVKGHIQ